MICEISFCIVERILKILFYVFPIEGIRASYFWMLSYQFEISLYEEVCYPLLYSIKQVCL